LVSLFNPRNQEWKEHFTWNQEGTEIMGITACGRATIVALRLNNNLAVRLSDDRTFGLWFLVTNG